MKFPSWVSSRLLNLALLSFLIPVFVPSALSQDQDEDEGYFEEVLVTAEKVEKSVMDTAMTITGFTSDMLREFNIQDRDKLQVLVPGLQFGETVDQTGQGTSLRGIGTRNAGIDHGDRSVATYIDGAYTVGVFGVAPGGGFDLERVEVARGPQGTLNGRNSIAGSLNYIYKKPSQEWDVDVMTQVNNFSQTRVNLAVGGPLTDQFSFRLTGGMHTGDGYQENVGAGEDMHAPEEEFYALQLRFQTEKFDTNFRYSEVTDRGIPVSRVQLANFNTTDEFVPNALGGGYGVINAPPTSSADLNPYYLYATQNPAGNPNCPPGMPLMRCGDLENKVAHNRNGFNDSRGYMSNFYAQYDFTENVSVKYTYSKNQTYQYTFRDGDYTTRYAGVTFDASADGGTAYLDRTYEVFYDYEEESHELVINWDVSDKLNVIVGGFQYESDLQFQLARFQFNHSWRFTDPDEAAASIYDGMFGQSVKNCNDFVNNIVGAIYGLPTGPNGAESFYYCPNTYGEFGRTHGDLTNIVPFGTGTSNETEAYFFNADYQINDSWSISGGLRYLEDKKAQPVDKFGGSYMFSFGGVPLVIGFFEGGTQDPVAFDQVVGQFTLEYRTAADNMIYGRISTGHKPGVFNFASPPIPGVPQVVEESTLTNYEAGMKGTFLDGQLQMAASAFLMEYDKMHLAAVQELSGNIPVDPYYATPLQEYIAAIPDSEVYGVEIEFNYAFSQNTSLVGFYTYTDSEVGRHSSVIPGDPEAEFAPYSWTDFETLTPRDGFYELPSDQTGNQLPNQPKNKLAASLIHNMDLSNGGTLMFMGTYTYRDDMYPTIGNVEQYKLPDTERIDLAVQYTSPEETWSAQLYVNNVADEIAVNDFVAATNFGGQSYLGSLTNHREIGLTVRWTPNL